MERQRVKIPLPQLVKRTRRGQSRLKKKNQMKKKKKWDKKKEMKYKNKNGGGRRERWV